MITQMELAKEQRKSAIFALNNSITLIKELTQQWQEGMISHAEYNRELCNIQYLANQVQLAEETILAELRIGNKN